MSTIYNPLADSSLSEFENPLGAGTAANSIAEESAPSVLNVGSSPSILPSLPSLPSGVGSALGSAFEAGAFPGFSSLPMSGLKSFFGFPVSQAVAIILGLLLIGGGIIMFRPELGEAAAKAAVA